jgi:hypothetical protein
MSTATLSSVGQLRNDFAVSSDFFVKFTSAPRSQAVVEKATIAEVTPMTSAEEERGLSSAKHSLLSTECDSWAYWMGL